MSSVEPAAPGAQTDVFRRIAAGGIVPVVRAETAALALAASAALEAGGIAVVEITMTVPGALEVIAELSRRAGTRLLVGAGTVLDAAAAGRCIAAGARFIVSPALDLPTVASCLERGVAVFPGALTPTEIVAAWRAGAAAVKVFPASAAGGPSYLRALRGPLPQIRLLPTGGVTEANAADYWRAGAWALGLGSELVDPAALRSGQLQIITQRARRLLEIAAAARNEAAGGAREDAQP